MVLTKKDKELEKTLNQYPKKIDKDIVVATLLNWEEKTWFWLFCVTKIMETPKIDIDEESKARLQKLKDEVLTDKTLAQKLDEVLEYEKKIEEKPDEDEIKIDKLIELGFEALEIEDALTLLSKTDWGYIDYNKSEYMFFDGDLSIKSADTVLFNQMPIIINGNLTIEGDLLELPDSGRLMVLGNLYTKNFFLWESLIYVQGTLFAKQLAMISSGCYPTQINNVETVFLYLKGDNSLCINKNAMINIDDHAVDFSDIVKQLKKSLLDKYYTITDYKYGCFDMDMNKIWEDVKLNKSIFKDSFLKHIVKFKTNT